MTAAVPKDAAMLRVLRRWFHALDGAFKTLERISDADPEQKAKWSASTIAYHVRAVTDSLDNPPPGGKPFVTFYRRRLRLTGL